ncbi:MAG: hypothetical protein WCF04_02845 [Candidatus Nanopelagicales bacterium]
MADRKGVLLRLDPAVHDALAKWAADELRSTNAQMEFLLRQALQAAGRLPGSAGAMRRPGRPRGTRGGPVEGGDPAGGASVGSVGDAGGRVGEDGVRVGDDASG